MKVEIRPRIMSPPTDEEVLAAIPWLAGAILKGFGDRLSNLRTRNRITITVHELHYLYKGPPKRISRLIGVRPVLRHKLYIALGGPDAWGPKPKYSHGKFLA